MSPVDVYQHCNEPILAALCSSIPLLQTVAGLVFFLPEICPQGVQNSADVGRTAHPLEETGIDIARDLIREHW